MQYVEYIQTDGYCWFDTNIVPDITTKVEMAFTPTSQRNYPWLGFIGAQNRDDSADTFQIRRNDKSNRFEPKVDSAYINVNYSQDTRYEVSLDKDTFVMNGNSYSIGASSMDTCNYTLYISAIHNPSWSSDSDGSGVPYRAGAAKYEEIKIYKNNVLVADLKPAIDNGNIGFYDSVAQAFRTKLGTGTPTAGPVLSSIVISPESKTFSSDGGSVQVSIQTENSWVSNPTDGSWYTISPTGGTGDSAVTISVPSYTGNTAREDTISFVDTNTTDEMVFTLKQKKYTTGQPFYLGGDEITEIYLGDDTISEAYLGEDLVFSTGPFEGLRVSPKSISFSDNSLSASVKIKSTEQWSLTTPAWISASVSTGDTGETIVTITATTQTAATSGSIVVTSANYSASTSVDFVLNRWMYVDSSSFDRTLPITKVRFHMNNVPAGTAALGPTEGCFSEMQNVNLDGYFSGNVDQETNGYPRSHKFNMVYQGGMYTNGSTAEISINTLTQVETGVYELTTNKTVYWSGMQDTTSPVYTNGNLIEVYVDYTA